MSVHKNMIKLSISQDSHGDYNVGPIMLFCYNVVFVSKFVKIECILVFLLLSINWNYHIMRVYVGRTAELFYLKVK